VKVTVEQRLDVSEALDQKRLGRSSKLRLCGRMSRRPIGYWSRPGKGWGAQFSPEHPSSGGSSPGDTERR
jgi:hypothetical protein